MAFGWVPPVADEREGLLAFLAQNRTALHAACFGLDDAQARSAPSASALTLAGLVNHLTVVERSWVDRLLPHISLEEIPPSESPSPPTPAAPSPAPAPSSPPGPAIPEVREPQPLA